MKALHMIALLAAFLPAQQYGRPAGVTFPPNPDPNAGVILFGSPDGRARVIDFAGREVIPGGIGSPFQGELLRVVEPLPDLTGFTAISVLNRGNAVHAVKVDWNGNLLHEWTLPAPFRTMHHDLEPTANGGLLVLANERLIAPNVSPKEIDDDVLVWLDRNSVVLHVWRLRDHIDQLGLTKEDRQLISDHGGDWAHANSAQTVGHNIRPDPPWNSPDTVVLSLRLLNRVVAIQKSSGAVAWTLQEPTFGQHHAQFVVDEFGSGTILLFDNGSPHAYPRAGRPTAPGHSRVQEFDLDTGAVVWSYDATMSGMFVKRFWSDIISGVQRLRNGNTFITEGVPGVLFIVNRQGVRLWEYVSPFGSGAQGAEGFNIYRAFVLGQ